MRVAIVGAGISGLSAAYRLNQIDSGVSVEIFDRRNRIGGVLETLERDGYEMELSADNFISTIPWGLQLCKELGLSDRLVQTNSQYRRTYVVRRGRLHLLPDGFLMMAPTKFLPMATTPILSPIGKLRAGLELFLPARRDNVDESMSNFVKRRFGREVFERLVEPLVSGVYAADMDKLSVLATLPRFREMERDHGSLIWAMKKQLAANRSANLAEQSGARYSLFVTLRGGLSLIVKAIESKLPTGSIKLGTEVESIKLRKDGKWIVKSKSITKSKSTTSKISNWSENSKSMESCGSLENSDSVDSNSNSNSDSDSDIDSGEIYDALILACSTYESSRLLSDVFPEISLRLSKIEHEGTAIVTYAFNSEQIKQRLFGMGFVVPKIENSVILAGSFSSLKYVHRAPAGKQLIRVFAGGARNPALAELSDEELSSMLLRELRPIIKIEGEPIFNVVSHWARTMPQYYVGHCELVREVERLSSERLSFAIAGNAFHGIGIPNCIKSGYDAAEKISRK
ncbi:MAG: protoporphyrinogen oxidase [Planctomycetaceae bacterium]|jgi:oxygen-dependent protoporphyrinogen oxidase|nr:protoporphyrinogen oxidase [Planctomycetaceae bacterium]